MSDKDHARDARLDDMLRKAAAGRFDAGFENRVIGRLVGDGPRAESLSRYFRWIAVPAAAACLMLAVGNVILADAEGVTMVEAMFGLPPMIGGLGLYL